MYDPTPGRWLSEDPIGFDAGDADLYRYVGNNPTNAIDPGGLLEVDDNPDNPTVKKLVNVNDTFNKIVELAVRNARETTLDPAEGVADVYRALATDNLVQRTAFETDLEKQLKYPNTIYQIPPAESRYSKVAISPNTEPDYNKIPYMWQSRLRVRFGQTSIIKISGVPIGLDKWGHFFQQGYWYFKASLDQDIWDKGFRDRFGTYMEGGPDVDKAIPLATRQLFKRTVDGLRRQAPFGQEPFPSNPPGFFGWLASGVVSNADKVANEAGYWFYKDLYDNWATINPVEYTFDIDKFLKGHNIDINMLNEYKNPNQFHPYLLKSVTGPQKKG